MQDEAFTLLYQKYANFVYSIALSYLKNPAEAEDVTADVFVKLLESDVSFPEDIAARAWLATVTRNQCKNLLRHWLRNKRDAEEVEERRHRVQAVYRVGNGACHIFVFIFQRPAPEHEPALVPDERRAVVLPGARDSALPRCYGL